MECRGQNVPGRKVWIIRHAKSSWDDPTLSDKERPLKKRGKKDAALIGAHLVQLGAQWDAVLSSPAKRARKTCEIICKFVGFDWNAVVIKKRLYFEGEEAILRVLQGLDDKVSTVAVFSHNPDLDSFLRQCGRSPDLPDFPTCGCACVEFAGSSWKEIRFDQARMTSFATPKMFK